MAGRFFCGCGPAYAVATTFPVIYDALKSGRRRVVLISHSQGTIITAVVLRLLYAITRPPVERRAMPREAPDVRPGAWGHLLNEHYLLPIERTQKIGRRRGGRGGRGGTAPFSRVSGADAGATPRLYTSMNGGVPPAIVRRNVTRRQTREHNGDAQVEDVLKR